MLPIPPFLPAPTRLLLPSPNLQDLGRSLPRANAKGARRVGGVGPIPYVSEKICKSDFNSCSPDHFNRWDAHKRGIRGKTLFCDVPQSKKPVHPPPIHKCRAGHSFLLSFSKNETCPRRGYLSPPACPDGFCQGFSLRGAPQKQRGNSSQSSILNQKSKIPNPPPLPIPPTACTIDPRGRYLCRRPPTNPAPIPSKN
jgi:hypothetical protein